MRLAETETGNKSVSLSLTFNLRMKMTPIIYTVYYTTRQFGEPPKKEVVVPDQKICVQLDCGNCTVSKSIKREKIPLNLCKNTILGNGKKPRAKTKQRRDTSIQIDNWTCCCCCCLIFIPLHTHTHKHTHTHPPCNRSLIASFPFHDLNVTIWTQHTEKVNQRTVKKLNDSKRRSEGDCLLAREKNKDIYFCNYEIRTYTENSKTTTI